MLLSRKTQNLSGARPRISAVRFRFLRIARRGWSTHTSPDGLWATSIWNSPWRQCFVPACDDRPLTLKFGPANVTDRVVSKVGPVHHGQDSLKVSLAIFPAGLDLNIIHPPAGLPVQPLITKFICFDASPSQPALSCIRSAAV